MITLRQRAAIADAILGAGATVLLLYSAASDRALWALATGIALVLLGMALLWGTPRPTLGARMLASIAGLLIAFGIGTLTQGPGGWVAIIAGVALMLGVLRATATTRILRRRDRA